MARPIKPTSRTSLRFVSPDDTAIGFEPASDEHREAWRLYNETFDERHLALTEAPAYYYVKILTLDAQQRFIDAWRAADEDDTAPALERMFRPECVSATREFIETNLVGCEEHTEVTEIRPDGTLATRTFKWAPGTPRPDGLVESVMADQLLAFNLIMFTINTNRLSEKEKKH